MRRLNPIRRASRSRSRRPPPPPSQLFRPTDLNPGWLRAHWSRHFILILFIAGLFAAAEIALGFGPGHFIVRERAEPDAFLAFRPWLLVIVVCAALVAGVGRSEEHTSELQSLMRISYAVFCLKKKKKN